MYYITKLHHQNLLEAKKMWLTIPPENVMPRLQDWRGDDNRLAPPDCNTVACFGGWCAWHPAFQAQGVVVHKSGAPVFYDGVEYDPRIGYHLFGDLDLFIVRGEHLSEKVSKNEDPLEYFATSDWQVVMNRINYVLATCVVRD